MTAASQLQSAAVGQTLYVHLPGHASKEVRITHATATLIVTHDGRKWNRSTGMPVPMRMYQGQCLKVTP